jgi:hypothetical protein
MLFSLISGLQKLYHTSAETSLTGDLEESFIQHTLFIEFADILNHKLSCEDFLEQVKESPLTKVIIFYVF